MRVLIVSEYINSQQRSGDSKYTAPSDITLDVTNISSTEPFVHSAFDYDVSIVHITKPMYNTIGYFENLPKIDADVSMALENGRTIICLPQSSDFVSNRNNKKGMRAYEWLENLGLQLKDNTGVHIRPFRRGQAKVIQDYLKGAPAYYQIISSNDPSFDENLATVDDTEIVVGVTHKVQRGRLVVLPPPEFGKHYISGMIRLMDVVRHFYETMRRAIPVGESPSWIDTFVVPEAKQIAESIKDLELQKERYDLIDYSLYGTDQKLEDSVQAMLEDLGLDVQPTPPRANIDLIAKQMNLRIGFAVEVTGTNGVIRKSSNKVSQCWQHLLDREGTDDADDRLVVIANTERHLEPANRNAESFTQDVVKLLATSGVLLIDDPALPTLARCQSW